MLNSLQAHASLEKKLLPCIFVEGNVGVGKTTFLKLLHEQLKIDVMYEPTDLWQNIDGHNLLEKFFVQPERWAFTFQSYVLQTRVDQLQSQAAQNKDQVSFVERSVFSGRYCFAQIAFENGYFNALEWSLYQKIWQREFINNISYVPQGFIYLRTPAQVCYDRIVGRARFEEQPITLQYLEQIEQKHDDWFIKKTNIDPALSGIEVLILDFTHDFKHDLEIQQNYIQKVADFIKGLT